MTVSDDLRVARDELRELLDAIQLVCPDLRQDFADRALLALDRYVDAKIKTATHFLGGGSGFSRAGLGSNT
jgi:hypothetical protein